MQQNSGFRSLLFVWLMFMMTACASPVLLLEPNGTPAPQETDNRPQAVEYNLGEATVVQDRFPAGDRFREMPVRLNGVIAAPSDQTGAPYPVVVILHGTHPGCPIPPGDHVDRWPCDPADEQPNYRGFAYLAERLAAAGYVALSININAENTFGFGEPIPGERLQQLLDLHLDALAAAAAGGPNDFGLPLTGQADLQRLTLMGHSRGGESAYTYAHSDAGSYADAVDGLLLIAAARVAADITAGSRVPLAVILPACDGDVIDQDGQHFYEAARLAPSQTAWATSAWLEQANHNHFNTILPGDRVGTEWRPDCHPLLDADAQRDFLAAYATDFLTTLYSGDPAQVRAAMLRMGTDVHVPAPTELYDLPAQVAALSEARNRLPIFVPSSVDELTTHRLGGPVLAEQVTTRFCPEGFYTPTMLPGSEPCRRATVSIPGQPALAVVDWTSPAAALRFPLSNDYGDLRFMDAISLRAALDPLSARNAPGVTPRFTIQLTDAGGVTDEVTTRVAEPALRFPPGIVEEDETFSFFSGPVPLMTVRAPLRAFQGVDLTAITEIALLFDHTPTGTLFLGDLVVERAPIAAQTTLDAPPSPELMAAAEAGDVEAMRQLANLYRPTEALGVRYGDVAQAVEWYRRACAAGYANAQVDFYEFARAFADAGHDDYLEEAIVCLKDAIRQGHRSAINSGAFRAAFIEQDYATGFFLYALFEETEPEFADQRWSFADQLTQAEIDAAEAQAAAWRAENSVRDYEDFFAEINSPFRQ